MPDSVFNVSVNFVVNYNMKKQSYFLSNKDKIPNLSKSNVVYEVLWPGCCESYIGQTHNAHRNDSPNITIRTKVRLDNTLKTVSACNI